MKIDLMHDGVIVLIVMFEIFYFLERMRGKTGVKSLG